MITFKSIFEFLFDSLKLKELHKSELQTHCTKFYHTFSLGDSSEFNLNDFYSELRMMQTSFTDVYI